MTEEVMDLFKDDDALSVAFKECAETFPGLMGPLTHEREMVRELVSFAIVLVCQHFAKHSCRFVTNLPGSKAHEGQS